MKGLGRLPDWREPGPALIMLVIYKKWLHMQKECLIGINPQKN